MPVIAALPGFDPDRQKDQAYEVPQAFVQEGRVHVYGRSVRADKPHAAEHVRLRAKGLAVHKIAPAAYDLPDEQAENDDVQHRGQRDLLVAADKPQRENAGDNAAVDGEAAVAQDEYLRGFCKVMVKLEEHVVEPRADYRRRDDDEDGVVHVVLLDAEARADARAAYYAEDEAEGYDDAVEVDFEAEHRKV